MPELGYSDAIDLALAEAMAEDDRVLVFGEDVPLLRRDLAARFGPDRVRGAPISESAFVGCAVGAAMADLRPVVEVMLVDFLGVCFDALLNHAAKFEAFSGGRWPVPLVVRVACGGGYGDGGQHEQCLWGLLAGVAGLSVVVPSSPADAAGLMRTALEHRGPVVFCEHKLLSESWLDWMGGASRPTVSFDVPTAGARGEVPVPIEAVPLGRGREVRSGADLALVSVGVGVHRCLEAADELAADGVEATVVDLRSVSPLDNELLAEVATRCRAVMVADEDYLRFGLSGEVAAVVAGVDQDIKFGRVGVDDVLPYARRLEDAALPDADLISAAAHNLLDR
jgi:pyruvate dehydrogenase E1 component beta subunit